LQIVELKEGPAGANTIEFVQLGKNKVLAKLEAKSKKEVDDWIKDFKKAKAELASQTSTKDKRTYGSERTRAIGRASHPLSRHWHSQCRFRRPLCSGA
jgi:hypothetical protein